MSSIKFNTKVIKETITNLNTENKYYSNKKDSFNSSNFSSAGKLTTYLNSIQTVYGDIANNIKKISDYLKDYADDAEGLENLMSGLGGSIKDSKVSGVVKNYKNTIDNYLIDDSKLFEIRTFNKSASGFASTAAVVASREAGSNSSNLGKTNNSTNEATNSSGVSTNGASMVSNDAGLFGGGLSRVGLNSVYDFNSGTYGLPQVEGMHYDFLTGAMVPDNSIDETTLTALVEIREMIDALITLGATEEEIDEFLACESVEESNQKLLELQMKYDPEVRAQIYEYSYVNSLNETFAEYGDSFSSLAEIDAKIAELNEQIASASEARNFTRIGEEGLLSAIELSQIDDINDDTVVLYAYQDPNDPSKFYYTAYDPNVFMSVPLFETTLENTSELSYTMESPKSYTLKEVLDLCDSETAAKFREAFLNDGSKDMKKSLQKEIESSIENPDVSAVEELIAQRDLYQYLSDYVKEELDYIEGSIDPYKYNSDFAENSQVSESALKDIENYTNTFEYLIDGFAGERSIIMPEMTDENTATLLYAVFNKTGDITYKNGYFYDKNGVNIPDASFNLLLNDFSKWEGELTSEEKGIYNYVYNTEGPLAAYEWLQGIASKIDNRYVNSKSEKAQAYAEAHPRLATLLSFNPLEKLSNSMKILYASATDQKIRNSYTVDNASIYRSTVGEIIGDKYGDGWQTVYNIGTSAVSESAWSIMHVVSGGATLYLKTAMSFFEGLPEQVGNALKRGYTDDQAVFSGLLCCGAEAATEYASAAKLLGIEDFDNYIFSPFIHVKFGATAASLYNVFVGQPAFEIMEELTSDGAERIIDSVLSNVWNHDSERDINYKKYLELYGNSEDAKRQLVKDYFNDIGNIALQTYFSTLVSSGVYMGAGRVKSGGSANSSSNQFTGDYQAALSIVNATSGNIDGNIDADTSSRAVDTMLKIKSGELSLGDIVKGKINTSPATNVENQTARVKEQPIKPLGQVATSFSQSTTSNANSEVKNTDAKTLAKQVKEASANFGYTAIEIPGTEVLNNNIVSNIKDSSQTYFTFTDANGETFGIFVPNSSETLESINRETHRPLKSENFGDVTNRYKIDSEHVLYYDMVTEKTYNYEDMAKLMQEHNAKAKSMFYETLAKIKANTKNPVILEVIDNFTNISNLTKSWDIVYDTKNSYVLDSDNVVHMSLESFSNPKRVEILLHEVSHSIHNAANNAQVPANYLAFLFKAMDYMKNHQKLIQKFSNMSIKYNNRFEQLATAKFDSEFDSYLRAQVFSEEERNKFVSSLEESASLTSDDIESLLQQEYEEIKDAIIYSIRNDYMRNREYATVVLNSIIGDIFGVAMGNPLNYIDENGNFIELSPSVIAGHDENYNKRLSFLSSSFHELMAEFGSGILLDEYNNSTAFSDGFIEIFGQEFYDFIKDFYLESLSSVAKGETHQYEAFSENDMKILSMYLKVVGNLMDSKTVLNADGIKQAFLNKNNVELNENGEYNIEKLAYKLSVFSQDINMPVVIDTSYMTNEQFQNLTNELIKVIGWYDINFDNVKFLLADGKAYPIDYFVLSKENTDLTSGYVTRQRLKKLSSKYPVYINVTGMNDVDIRNLITGITSYDADGIDFNNVKFLNNGSLSDVSLILNKEYMITEFGTQNYNIKNDLMATSQYIPVTLDFSGMDFEIIKSIFNDIDADKENINFNNVTATIIINGVTYNIDYDTLRTYVETQTIPQVENKGEQLIEDLIVQAIGDDQSFEDLAESLKKYDDNNLPKGYQSIEEMQHAIAKKILESGQLDSLSDRNIAFLIEGNPYILQDLIGTSKFDEFVISNMENLSSFYAQQFKTLDDSQISQVFDTETVQKFFASLSDETFIKVLKSFTGKGINIFASDTLQERLLNCNVNALGNISPYDISDILRKAQNEASLNFVKKFIDKLKNSNIDNNALSYLYKLTNAMPTYGIYQVCKEDIANLNSQYKNQLLEILSNNSAIPIPTTLNEDGWYDLTFTINGEEFSKSFIHNTKLGFDILDKLSYIDDIANGNLRVISLEKNEIRSNLDLKNIPQDGLTKFTLEIDGEVKSIVEKVSGGNCNLCKYLDIDNITSAKVLSYEPLSAQSYNFEAPSTNKLYKMSYTIDGVNYVKYLTPRKLFGETSVNVDYFITSNNLYNIENVNIEEVSDTSTLLDYDIFKLPGSNEVFGPENFGGRQSQVEDLVIANLEGKDMSLSDKLKSDELINLIKTYYPDATPTDIKNIAKNMAKSGCFYIAIANSFIAYMNSLENGGQQFKDKMGYDLYYSDDGKKTFNNESVALEMFLYNCKNILRHNTSQAGSKDDVGLSSYLYDGLVSDFFKSKGFEVEVETLSADNSNINEVFLGADLNNPNGILMLAATDFDLKGAKGEDFTGETDGALANAVTDGEYKRGVGSHAMSIVGVNENGNLLVSSWGREFEFVPTDKTNNVNIFVLKFNK